MPPPSPQWTPLQNSSRSRLDLAASLFNGQAFTWRRTAPHCFSNTIAGFLVSLKQLPGPHSPVLFKVHHPAVADTTVVAGILSDYFHLHIDSDRLRGEWSRNKMFASRTVNLPAIRLLRQDPTETLFAFICSANNNISRITGMVNALAKTYGVCVGRINHSPEDLSDENAANSDETYVKEMRANREADFYAFPSADCIRGRGIPGTVDDDGPENVESVLRQLGFGYRAGYIAKTARILREKPNGGDAWLFALRDKSYEEARTSLLELHGVGPKVADCILLMSLDKYSAVPVDTHVWRIAKRDYGLQSSSASLTAKLYQSVGNRFRELFGEYAGWAQSFLFSAEINIEKTPRIKEEGTTEDIGQDENKFLPSKKRKKDVR